MKTNRLLNTNLLLTIAIAVVMSAGCKKAMQTKALAKLSVGKMSRSFSSLPGGKRLFAYFTASNYNTYLDSIETSLLTDISFIGDGQGADGKPPIRPDMIQAINRAHDKGLNVFITIGSANTVSMYEPQNRSAYIHNLREYLTDYNYDGLDLDYEASGITQYFSGFIVELSDTLRQYNKKLSMAIASYQGPQVSQDAYDRLDFLNPMIYDYIYSSPQSHASYTQYVKDINYFLTKVPASKINAGIPAYTWAYVNGKPDADKSFVGYKQVIARSTNNAFTNWVPISANEQWFYDGQPVVRQKVAYAMQKNLGGIMFFHILCDTRDDKTSLIKLINYCFSDTSGFNPNDSCSIVNIGTGKTFLVAGASTADGASVVQGPGNVQNSQLWKISFVNGGNFGVLNVHSGKALDVSGASMANGAPLIQSAWNQAQNQLFKLSPNAIGYYTITAVQSNKVLEVAGWSSLDGAAIVQNPPNGGTGQQWVLIKK